MAHVLKIAGLESRPENRADFRCSWRSGLVSFSASPGSAPVGQASSSDGLSGSMVSRWLPKSQYLTSSPQVKSSKKENSPLCLSVFLSLPSKSLTILLGSAWVLCPRPSSHCGLGNGGTARPELGPSLNSDFQTRVKREGRDRPLQRKFGDYNQKWGRWMCGCLRARSSACYKLLLQVSLCMGDGVQGDPLGQRLPVDGKEQKDPVRAYFLYNVGLQH